MSKPTYATFHLLRNYSSERSYLYFIDYIKQNIPASKRVYYPVRNDWVIDSKYANVFIELAQQFSIGFNEVGVYSKAGATAPMPRANANPANATTTSIVTQAASGVIDVTFDLNSVRQPPTREGKFHLCVAIYDDNRNVVAIKRLASLPFNNCVTIFVALLRKLFAKPSFNVAIDPKGKFVPKW